jgi:phage shock protein E
MQTLIFIAGLVAALFIYWYITNTIKRKKVRKIITGGAVVVDVRTPGEFGNGHYRNAINIPVDSIQKNISRFGAKDKPVIVYCASGTRSSVAAGVLKKFGFTEVFNAGSLSNMPE